MYVHENHVRNCLENKKDKPNYLKNPKLYYKIRNILSEGNNVIYKKILENATEKQALNTEEWLIDEIGLENLCNLTYGGEGNTLSKEAKIKKSLALKGRIFSKEHRKRISKALKGKSNQKNTKIN